MKLAGGRLSSARRCIRACNHRSGCKRLLYGSIKTPGTSSETVLLQLLRPYPCIQHLVDAFLAPGVGNSSKVCLHYIQPEEQPGNKQSTWERKRAQRTNHIVISCPRTSRQPASTRLSLTGSGRHHGHPRMRRLSLWLNQCSSFEFLKPPSPKNACIFLSQRPNAIWQRLRKGGRGGGERWEGDEARRSCRGW